MEAATVVSPAPVTANTFENVATIENVKVVIPARESKWRVGVFNADTKQVKQLGQGEVGVIAGLSRKSNPNEDIFFLLGLGVDTDQIEKERRVQVIVNRSYHGINAIDFGKSIVCTVKIDRKTVGVKKFTSISLTKSNGACLNELVFDLPNFSEKGQPAKIPAEAEKLPIEGTAGFICIVPLKK